ncbi:MAG TPA: acyl-CoA thioesterase [Polyangiaceae bacterium]|nr:acyl-CoA thioesterase [Polyangiaceae bacterium]
MKSARSTEGRDRTEHPTKSARSTEGRDRTEHPTPHALPAKARAASVTEMTEYVLPQHANVHGTVFGGQIMAWVDLCAAICAQRHAGRPCVTAFVDDLLFKRPVQVGQVVRLRAHVTATFRTSMEIEVRVGGEDTVTGEVWPTVECRATFVAMSDAGAPTPVPPLRLDTDDDRTAQSAAEERRRARLAKR